MGVYLQVRKMGKCVKQTAQIHTAGDWEGWNLNLELTLLSSMMYFLSAYKTSYYKIKSFHITSVILHDLAPVFNFSLFPIMSFQIDYLLIIQLISSSMLLSKLFFFTCLFLLNSPVKHHLRDKVLHICELFQEAINDLSIRMISPCTVP